MGKSVMEIVVKALAGGLLVLAFAAVAQILSPKRFAGIFAAAPSVALASLIVTVTFTGDRDVPAAAAGMAIGAAGFALYCLAAVPLVRRFGAWRGSALALIVWGLACATGYAAVLA